MGQSLTYKCPKCGYSACVDGGVGAGMQALSITCICDKCHILQDVFYISVKDLLEKQKNLEAKGQVPKESKEKPLPSSKSRCEKCHCKKYLRIWDEKKRPCPICGTKMEVDEMGMVLMWD